MIDPVVAQLTALARAGSEQTPQLTPLPQAAPATWGRISALAVGHGVAPLVYRAIDERGGDAVPASVRRYLLFQVQQNIGAGLLHEHALGRLLATLATAGIDLIVLKGAALAHRLYPQPELRQYGDIDVLCRPNDYARLHGVLRTEGYETGDHAGALKTNPSPIESYFPRPFRSPIGQTLIEVHFDVLQFGLVERHSDDLWRESVMLDTSAFPIRVLAPHHQLLQLAAHVHRHSYSRLIWLLDLDLSVRHANGTVDWRQVSALARDEGMGAIFRYALHMAHVLLGTPPPQLGPMTAEERLLTAYYRRLWPADRLGSGIRQEQRHRLTRFYPETGIWRDVVPGLLLSGRRRAKLRVLARYWRQRRTSAW